MNPSLERLNKILKLEAQQGYLNTAVIGGLARMLPFWEPEARKNIEAGRLEQIIAFMNGYAALDAKSRVEALQAQLAEISSEQAAPQRKAQPSPPPAAPPAPPRPPAPERREPPPARPAAPTPAAAAPRPPAKPESTRSERPASTAPPTPRNPAREERRQPAPPQAPRQAREPAPRPAPAREPSPAPRKRTTPRPAGAPATLDAPLTVLHSVGPKTAKTMERLGLATLGDMLTFYPRRYDDFSQMKPINRLDFGEEVTIIGTVWETSTRKTRGGQASVTQTIVSDSTGTIECSWFNQPWLAEKFTPGLQVVLSGRIQQYLGRLVMQSPSYDLVDREMLHAGRIVPVYALTQGITARWLREKMNTVVVQWAPRVPDPLPEAVRERADLMDLPTAFTQIHFPDDQESLAAARARLAFDELMRLQLGALRQRADWQSAPAHPLAVDDTWLAGRLAALPFKLTAAQERVLADLRGDLARPTPMTRLLQGDVGSGKTVLAALAAALAHASGKQAAIMAPTGILAEQHYRSFSRLLSATANASSSDGAQIQSGGPVSSAPRIALLLGATPESEKQAIYEGLKSGEIDIVVGTHALLEAPVLFANLALAVIDEQHRFGVSQRAVLRNKGGDFSPHLLVMSATPIPRSLALTLYGDLDLSVLDEMPPGRQPIETRIIYQNERERAYAFVRMQIKQGRQAYIVCPLVEESDKIEAKAAVDEYERLQKHVFPDLRLGLLHGRLKGDEKEEVMGRFQAGELDILISTSVVEVGVDVPNASVMLIEGANRFGLAQLHQFRGRVGRGEHQSYCLLVSDLATPNLGLGPGDERLKALEQSQDGFELAAKDLEFRGPGEFMGTRQAGFGDLQLAKLSDLRLIEMARREAQAIFREDANLERPEHKLLSESLSARPWTGAGDVS